MQRYMVEVARIVHDHTGLLLRWSSIPCFELQRDTISVNSGKKVYNFCCVLVDRTEAGGHEFTDPKLKALEWHLKEDAFGQKAWAPNLPGPDHTRGTMWKMCPRLGQAKETITSVSSQVPST